MKKIALLTLMISNFILSFSQDLFESALKTDEKTSSYQLNGDLRGVLYIGENNDKAVLQSSYGEAALKFSADKQNFGKAYAEIRLKSGYEFNKSINEILLREAWVNFKLYDFDFIIGKQIISWGRADGINPTDQITPKNFIVRSPDPDDIRLGNFLLQAKYAPFNFLKISGIWVPRYIPSYMPIEIAEMPTNVKFNGIAQNDFKLSNSELMVKFDFLFNKFDGSVSYKRGYGQYPGLAVDSINFNPFISPVPDIYFSAKPFKQHVFGADFSTTIASFGFRGECAYQLTKDYDTLNYIPNPDLQLVLGVDKQFGKFMIIAQYIGRFITDFKEIPQPVLPLDAVYNQMENYNRLMFLQTNKSQHSISLRPSLKLLHDNLELEIFGMYDITTEEYLLMPKATYNVTDAFAITAGGQYYHGKNNTMYNLIAPALNSGYIQCKVSF